LASGLTELVNPLKSIFTPILDINEKTDEIILTVEKQ
jgi:hypothetical protein